MLQGFPLLGLLWRLRCPVGYSGPAAIAFIWRSDLGNPRLDKWEWHDVMSEWVFVLFR